VVESTWKRLDLRTNIWLWYCGQGNACWYGNRFELDTLEQLTGAKSP
jgi:hypothetical protein